MEMFQLYRLYLTGHDADLEAQVDADQLNMIAQLASGQTQNNSTVEDRYQTWRNEDDGLEVITDAPAKNYTTTSGIYNGVMDDAGHPVNINAPPIYDADGGLLREDYDYPADENEHRRRLNTQNAWHWTDLWGPLAPLFRRDVGYKKPAMVQNQDDVMKKYNVTSYQALRKRNPEDHVEILDRSRSASGVFFHCKRRWKPRG